MAETYWTLTNSQILALQAVEEKLAFWENERQRRATIAFQELAAAKGKDPATHQGRLQLHDGQPAFLVTLLGPPETPPDAKK